MGIFKYSRKGISGHSDAYKWILECAPTLSKNIPEKMNSQTVGYYYCIIFSFKRERRIESQGKDTGLAII